MERNAKFLSNQTEADLCTAVNAILNEDPHEDIKLTGNIFVPFCTLFSFFLTLMIISRTYTLHKTNICLEILFAEQF